MADDPPPALVAKLQDVFKRTDGDLRALTLALTVILFVVVLAFYKGVATLPLLLTFIATLVVYWVALLIVF